MVRSIGADQVIDYTQQSFTNFAQPYDLIFDLVGNHPLSAPSRVLTPTGTLIICGGSAGKWMIGPLTRFLTALVRSPFGKQTMVGLLAKSNRADLASLQDLLATQK